MVGVGTVRGRGAHSHDSPRDACSSPGGARNHEGHSLSLSSVPGLCLLGITVWVTKSLLSWGWQSARLGSSR